MQRIDENTYIDDTLVTCAEYQLFIDEMREQGKYYQPDHWTTYQFPKGQAREPILGMRHSDVVAFCKWLTNRESKEWKFRLPNQEEAKAFPIKHFGKDPLGYWVGGKDHFIWVGSVPENPRNLALNRALDLDLVRALDLDLDFDIAHGLDLYLEPDFGRTRDLNRALNRVLDLDLDLDRVLALDLDRALDIYIDLFTLQERIAGRSPAFEGIRLVKERIR